LAAIASGPLQSRSLFLVAKFFRPLRGERPTKFFRQDCSLPNRPFRAMYQRPVPRLLRLVVRFPGQRFQSGASTMEWTTPQHEEIDLNCEISSYANAEL